METSPLVDLQEKAAQRVAALKEVRAVLHHFREENGHIIERLAQLEQLEKEAEDTSVINSMASKLLDNLERFQCIRCGISWLRDKEHVEMRVSEFREQFRYYPHIWVGPSTCKKCKANGEPP